MPARAARLLFQLPQGCRVFTKLLPGNQWGWAEVLANKANYLLEVLAWQNANQGVKKSRQSRKPQPFIPDFMKPKPNPTAINKEAEKRTVDDIRSILALPRG